LSAPSQLHRSVSVEEGAKDLRRLQRWRTAVQKKNNSLGVTSHRKLGRHSMDYGTIVDDIFAFIGTDCDKAVRGIFLLCLVFVVIMLWNIFFSKLLYYLENEILHFILKLGRVVCQNP